MKKYTLTYEITSIISEEINAIDIDQVWDKAYKGEIYNKIKNKYLPKVNLKNKEINLIEVRDNETNEITGI